MPTTSSKDEVVNEVAKKVVKEVVKKVSRPWIQQDLLSIGNREPGRAYRWCRVDELGMLVNNGYRVETKRETPNHEAMDMIGGTDPAGRINQREMFLVSIEKEAVDDWQADLERDCEMMPLSIQSDFESVAKKHGVESTFSMERDSETLVKN